VTAPRALALSDKQLALLQRAAASLPVGERDHFLQSVAAHLTGAPTDDAVIAAINAALDAAAVGWRAALPYRVPARQVENRTARTVGPSAAGSAGAEGEK
jgi:hypothetical protein